MATEHQGSDSKSLSLNYGYDYFIDSARQTATKRLTHKKFWNVAIHTFGSWVMAWAFLSIGKLFLPFTVQMLLILFSFVICIIQEPPIGFAYCVVYSLVAYHALVIKTGVTLFQALLVVAMALGLQFLGHQLEAEPFTRVSRGEGIVFEACDLMNELLLPQYHFSVLLFMRLDLLPVLKWRSDVELRKAMDRVQEIKYGSKHA